MAGPIEHVVIIVKENHTFDSYFGTLPGVEGITGLDHAADPPSSDHRHDHQAWLQRDEPPPVGAVRAQYWEADIPAYFAYARQFTLCDHYFTDVASQSEPNHLALIAAATPIIDNSSAHRTYQPQPPFDLPSLPASLEAAGLTWRNYGGYYHQHIRALADSPHNVASAAFDADVAAGALPSVSWLYAPESHGRGTGLSEHPAESVHDGMLWTVGRVNRLAQSPYWASSAIFITWDDWGGWYDHVTPPLAATWPGGGGRHGDYAGTQFRYGPRVGCLVLSPYARGGYVSTAFHSHASIVRFCEETFGLGTLGGYDEAADAMADCFDLTRAPAGPPSWSPGP